MGEFPALSAQDIEIIAAQRSLMAARGVLYPLVGAYIQNNENGVVLTL